MKKTMLIFIVIAALVSGCEKYTLNTIYGFYTITSYRVNDADSLDLYRDSLGVDFHFFTMMLIIKIYVKSQAKEQIIIIFQ